MHLTALRLRDFRNYAALDLAFSSGIHLFLGKNGQGKTNVLEAIYLLATLRSFRGVGGAQMIRHGQKGYFIGSTLVSDVEHRVKIYWSQTERKLSLDSQNVSKLTDYLGVLKAVIFCTEDLLLIKGPSRVRRRFLDLLLTQTYPGYLPLLQRYTTALRSRNALLKHPAADLETMVGFTRQLIEAGQEIMKQRAALLPIFVPMVQAAYAGIAGPAEEISIDYASAVKGDFAVALAQSQARERIMRATVVGPHRDDVAIRINAQPAAAYASEGQKRTLAIALKMAQAAYLRKLHGITPVLLIDDVMGELDRDRRSEFLPMVSGGRPLQGQIFVTATEQNWPEELGVPTQKWEVIAGAIRAP